MGCCAKLEATPKTKAANAANKAAKAIRPIGNTLLEFLGFTILGKSSVNKSAMSNDFRMPFRQGRVRAISVDDFKHAGRCLTEVK